MFLHVRTWMIKTNICGYSLVCIWRNKHDFIRHVPRNIPNQSENLNAARGRRMPGAHPVMGWGGGIIFLMLLTRPVSRGLSRSALHWLTPLSREQLPSPGPRHSCFMSMSQPPGMTIDYGIGPSVTPWNSTLTQHHRTIDPSIKSSNQ